MKGFEYLRFTLQKRIFGGVEFRVWMRVGKGGNHNVEVWENILCLSFILLELQNLMQACV